MSGPKVKRGYPEKIFCREASGRCVASAADRTYFCSDNHVSGLGSDLIVSEVVDPLALDVPETFSK